ncbi:MAG: PDZ domain-containing protein [Planctomycetota bacterium]
MRFHATTLLVAAFALFTAPEIPAQISPNEDLPDLRSPERARLLRMPHVQGDRLAFVKGGDLWVASLSDLRARRLTSFDDGAELFPRISPDGSLVAFSGEYDGSRQIFVVPFEGGTPTQLTFYPDVGPMPPRGGYDHLPLDWTPDGRHILFRANRTPYGQRVGKYFLVRADGQGMERALQIPEGGPATFSPDGSKLAYNIISREWRTWKRYTAGRAQDVYVYDLTGNRVEQLTDFEGTDNHPMWLGNRIYFTSDRTGTLELWCHDVTSSVQRRVTDFRSQVGSYDVLWPARGDSGIVFENGGDLWLMEKDTEDLRRLDITLADDQPWTRPVWKDGAQRFGDFTTDDGATKAVVEFRGDLFLLEPGESTARHLCNTPARRERQPVLSPDGRRVAFVAENGLDLELYVKGLRFGEEIRLTTGVNAWIRSIDWSPDGSRIAATDNQNRLWTVDPDTRKLQVLDEDREGPIRQVQWAHDSKTLCYVKTGVNGHGSVFVAGVDGQTPVQVTSGDWNDSSPTFTPDGHTLFFVSARDFVYGDLDFDQRVYGVLLREGAEHPLRSKPGDAGAEVSIDEDGLEDRVFVLPLPPGSYFAMLGVEGGLVMGTDNGWKRFDFESESAQDLPGLGGSWALSPSAKSIIARQGGSLSLGSFRSGRGSGDEALDTSAIRVRIHPPTEWAQMFTDAWRIMRDFFYDPTMHRTDWIVLHAKYFPLVFHMSSRDDLDYLLGELIGEVNAGHTYVNDSSEAPSVARETSAGLGCEFEVVEDRYRIAKIFEGENWNESTRSPLTEIGIDIDEGDFLLAIDGRPLHAHHNPYEFLLGKIGQDVELLVNDRPLELGARRVVVKARAGDQPLRYVDWVKRNRRIVDELSGGRVGYIHVPNTAVPGHRELYEGWYAQARAKEAMLIDDRYNGGGFIPDGMAHQVADGVLNYWARRHLNLSSTPSYGFDGPRAMLINGYSSSGGDAFPYYFRKLGAGKLIGSTTWGGLIGYTGSPRLVDGGGLAVPSFSFVNTNGQWDVEAFGVDPDIEVFDDPSLIQAGREPVLEAGVRHLLRELEQGSGHERPDVPAYPDRRDPVDPGTAPTRR